MTENQASQTPPPTGGTTVATGFPDEIKSLGDIIAGLTVKEAVDLGGYLKDSYGIEAPEGGVAIQAPTPIEKEPEKTTFDVVLVGVPDATKKIAVIKEVRALTQLGIKEAKEMVDGAPKTVKENATKEEADKIKQTIEAAGGKIELK